VIVQRNHGATRSRGRWRPEPPRASSRTRGVSLVEALVALAVMAIGMLGVAGMQSVLRSNADNAKQRTEAVRIAQQQIEGWRAFEQLQLPPVAGPDSYDDIAADVFNETPFGANTVYQVNLTAQPVLAAPARPPFKSVAVELSWPDRTGTTQSFVLAGGIAGMPPALPAALGTPGLGDPVRVPAGRDRGIPVDAVVEVGGDTSRFDPPGSADFWRFSHDTGLVIATCEIANPANCTPLNALVISGYIRYAYGATPPTSADAAQPQDAAIATAASLSTGGSCAVQVPPGTVPPVPRRYLAYYCLVPLTAVAPTWTGKVVLSLPDLPGLPPKPIATTRGEADPLAFKICRYTPEASHTPTGGNVDHPLQYTALGRSVANKNFLVIAAGSGSLPTSHDCPSGLPPVNTYWHQPE
jgi:type II secretory pathway pseudopilin PulG